MYDCIIVCCLNLLLHNLGPASQKGTTEEVPDWTEADYLAMELALEGINWVEEFGNKSEVECMDVFYELVRRLTSLRRQEGRAPNGCTGPSSA